jgi:hypothetical protein
MIKRFLRHKTLPMIAVSVTHRDRTNGPADLSLVRVNRYRTFQSPIETSLLGEHFDECSEAEYKVAFERFPDRHNGSWEVDIVTGVERQVFLT